MICAANAAGETVGEVQEIIDKFQCSALQGIAERYERRSIFVASNMVFSQWEEIFQSPMATAAAIDRIVHHSAILEFDVASYRTAEAQAMQAPSKPRAGGSGRPATEKNTRRSPGARTRRKTGRKQ